MWHAHVLTSPAQYSIAKRHLFSTQCPELISRRFDAWHVAQSNSFYLLKFDLFLSKVFFNQVVGILYDIFREVFHIFGSVGVFVFFLERVIWEVTISRQSWLCSIKTENGENWHWPKVTKYACRLLLIHKKSTVKAVSCGFVCRAISSLYGDFQVSCSHR